MKTIWKYKLNLIGGKTEIEMPERAQIRLVAAQRQEVCIWAQVNPENKKEIRRFEIFGTGQTITALPDDIFNEKYVFVGSFLMVGGMVFHLYERCQ